MAGKPSALPTWVEGAVWGGHANDFTAWETDLFASYRTLWPADVFDVDKKPEQPTLFDQDDDKGV